MIFIIEMTKNTPILKNFGEWGSQGKELVSTNAKDIWKIPPDF